MQGDYPRGKARSSQKGGEVFLEKRGDYPTRAYHTEGCPVEHVLGEVVPESSTHGDCPPHNLDSPNPADNNHSDNRGGAVVYGVLDISRYFCRLFMNKKNKYVLGSLTHEILMSFYPSTAWTKTQI